jgi:uncharacterized protein (TIGR02001 family)
MNKTILAVAAALGFTALPSVSFAQDASPLSFNVGAFTDYRYRGISQTRLKPAIQAGVDYAAPAGWYVGAWGSNIKWIKDGGGDAGIEIDFYGGYKGEIQKDFTYDVGFLTYQYPGHKLATSPNTNEIYGALTYGPATVKYSHSVSNLFGATDINGNGINSKNSGYFDLSATFEVSGITLVPHIGYQKVSKRSALSYTDYSLTASKDFSGFVLSAALVGADVKTVVNPTTLASGPAYSSPDGKNLGKAGLVLGIKKTF